MQFEAFPPRAENPRYAYTIQADTSGKAKLITQDGRCLTVGRGFNYEFAVTLNGCNVNDENQTFHFIPQNREPTANVTEAGRQYFYIASTRFEQCIYSPSGLTDPFFGPDHAELYPRLVPCSSGDTPQEYRVHNERINAFGAPVEWRNILNLAIRYAAGQCVKDDETCRIQSPGETDWHRPSPDNPVFRSGTVAVKPTGCGVGSGALGSQVHNLTAGPLAITVKTSTTLVDTSSTTDSMSASFNSELMKNVPGIVKAKIQEGLSISGTTISTKTTTNTFEQSDTTTLQAGDWYTSQWSSPLYSLRGAWKFANNVGNVWWTLPSAADFAVKTSTLPFTTKTFITSHDKKSCFVGPAATNAVENSPKLTSDLASCDSPTIAQPTGAIGSTVYICPGIWNSPTGAIDPVKFAYQWQVTPDTTKIGTPIPGATGSSLTIMPSTRGSSQAPVYLVAQLTEVGSALRQDSLPTQSTNDVVLAKPALGDPLVFPTTFAGDGAEATADVEYSADLVTEPGTDMALSVSPVTPLPAGLSLSADGVLSGTPTEPGVYAFTILDQPAAGRAAQSQSFALTVHAAEVVYAAPALTATPGAEVSLPLVQGEHPDLALEVIEGALPDGIVLDPATGLLSGAAVDAGTWSFTVQNAAAVVDAPASFELTVADAPIAFSNAAAPAGTVGAPYSATLLAATGTDPFVGLAAGSEPLPEGLQLNALTGVLSGTPTTAGVSEVTVGNADGSLSATFTVRVAAAAGPVPEPVAPSPAPTSGAGAGGATTGSGSLAATGSDAGAAGAAALLALLLGLAGAVAIRRTRLSRS
ncbi:Ig domain-containing protein [Herbiconiux sp.]|uniref:Ig domain-containing protein n=1 Tax=Herbiconiux sp. TaxID=1871186 RepID=UPI0025BDF73F|nr:Ig domain-containing protein [Herbiconiux sp.]